MTHKTAFKLNPLLLIIALFAFAASRASAQATPAYKSPKAALEARVKDLFLRMTQDEKMGMLTGTEFTTNPIPRLGVPAMGMADAGQGVRGGMNSTLGPATLFPSGVAMASTWDPTVLRRIGQCLGEEVQNKGTGAQVLLGPAVNIQRSPLGGRNGEYFSEDPFLAARLDVPYIQGLQSTGAAACVKHYACNNEEVDRGSVNVHVDERTLREIYLPAFEAAVKEGHVWTLMSSYNEINGFHATASHYLLTDVLREGWGYDGLVMSDWGAVHETAGVVRAGNDLEMPGPGLVTREKLLKALKANQVTQTQIDDSVKRILRAVIRVGLLDGPLPKPDHAVVNAPAHRQTALDAASEAITLLKNEGGVLPLSRARVRTLALIGPRVKSWQMGAAGSPSVDAIAPVSPFDGITKRAGTDGVKVVYAPGVDLADVGVPIPANALTPPDGTGHGLKGEYFTGEKLEGVAKITRTDGPLQFDWNTDAPGVSVARTHFGVRWTGTLTAPVSGKYTLAIMSDDGCRLFLGGKQIIENWLPSSGAPRTAVVTLEAGHPYPVRCEYFQAEGKAFFHLNWLLPGRSDVSAAVQEAARVAASADMAVVIVGSSDEGEGTDRPSLDLPNGQDALITAVARANPNTVVVLNNGTPCLMPWLSSVPGVLEAWFPGEEGGTALASILFGDVNPSGHLTTTLGVRREDYPDVGHFPGVKNQVTYAEGIYVGYRHFDKAQIAPLFPFGHGLSYTTFRYGHLTVASPGPKGVFSVHADITNTGARAGAEVVQLYVHDTAPKIDKPVRELKGFARVTLQPGETQTVSLPLTGRDLAYCDVPGKQWRADAGTYEIQIGASSRDIRLTNPLRLARTWTQPIPGLGAGTLPPAHDPADLAFGRPTLASASETPDLGPENAVDGDPSTRWSSGFSDPQWIAVDLGKTVPIRRVRLTWEDAYATAYALQVSPDGKTWTDVSTQTNGQGGVETATFAPRQARWVRVYCTKRVTQFGDSLFSFEVFK